MNDRYLYRAKRIDNGEWVEGYYAIARDFRGIEQHNILIADNSLGYFKWIVVDPSTICQYTQSGRCTLDENKIWENDIVACGKYRGVVKFGLYNSKHLGFYIEWIKGYEYLKKDFSYWIPKIKVIGNIFDSPELLERGE